MKKEKISAKEKVIAILKSSDGVTPSNIASTIGINYYYAKRLLSELEKEGKAEQIKSFGKANYWRARK